MRKYLKNITESKIESLKDLNATNIILGEKKKAYKKKIKTVKWIYETLMEQSASTLQSWSDLKNSSV